MAVLDAGSVGKGHDQLLPLHNARSIRVYSQPCTPAEVSVQARWVPACPSKG